MREIVFEVCTETMEATLAAEAGGADRIELCSALSEGGVTPGHGLIGAAVAQCGLPINVIIRPRGGDFFYSASEIEIMCEDILHAKSLGAAGVVLGLLRPDRTVDTDATRRMVRLAHPMQVTFHRAFDNTASVSVALEDVIATGCHRILTSGGEMDVVAGAEKLAALVTQAAGRIDIAVGGGLRLGNAEEVARITGARHFHASLRRPNLKTQDAIGASSEPPYIVHVEDVRTMVRTLRGNTEAAV